MISISHSPNSNFSQSLLALSYLLWPWKWAKWKNGKNVEKLEKEFARYHGIDSALAFLNGRTALYAVLKALGVTNDDEVIIQAYTCIVVPNTVLWLEAKPVYVDIDQTLNMDPQKIEEKITQKTKAIIVQHSFGVPADMTAIAEICQRHNLKLVEDCAHSLGAKVGGKLVGTIGDAAIFSFGRDKVISSVWGGMAIAKNSEVQNRLLALQEQGSSKSSVWIFQSLMHPILMPWMSRLIGRARIGQGLILLSQKLGLLNKVYAQSEKNSEAPLEKIHSMPNALAALALQQFKLLDSFNLHRKKIAAYYRDFCHEKEITYQQKNDDSDPIYLRFTIQVDNVKQVLKAASRRGFIIGDWYYEVVVPRPDYKKIHYKKGNCPNAEKAAQKSVNLPTHHKMTIKHVDRLLKML